MYKPCICIYIVFNTGSFVCEEESESEREREREGNDLMFNNFFTASTHAIFNVVLSTSIPQIQFLDSVPDIHMHEHVQEFIDGLFCILGDERKEIRRM